MTLNIRVRCALSGILRVISTVIKSFPGDLSNENVYINYFTPFGVNGSRIFCFLENKW